MTALILSNYGLRRIENELRRTNGVPPEDGLLAAAAALRADVLQPLNGELLQQQLIDAGLAQTSDLEERAVRLRYRQNPLEHIEQVVFEYTTLCNLDCSHCRNGHLAPKTEGRPDALMEAVDVMIPLGVTRFDFVGGEVTLYGNRWLDVVRHIAGYEDTIAAVVTSGWFLGETKLRAAGTWYDDAEHYLRALEDAGVTHVVYSLDGEAEEHDRIRGVPGLFERVMDGLELTRDVGLAPRVSLLVREDQPANWIADVSDRIYGTSPGQGLEDKLARLFRDPTNYVSNFIDVGNGVVNLSRRRTPRSRVPDALLRCKNFFRPSPSLRIQATGRVSLCPLVEAGEGYGDVHESGLLRILNTMQDRFVYKLHAESRIADYRRFLDPAIFGENIDHVCTLRTVVTMLAREMEERGIDPNDEDALRQLNIEVAQKTGYLPPATRKATGIRLPY